MQIVLVDTTLTTPPTGGPHTFLVALARELVHLGWSVAVVTQRGPDVSACRALVRVGARVVVDLWRSWHLPEERARRLAAWVRAERPDIFVVSNSQESGWLALPLLPPSLPTVTVAHGDMPAYYQPLCHYAAFVDAAVGVSAEVARKLTATSSMPGERTHAIPYGIEPLGEAEALRQVAPRPGAPLRIGYIGRVVQEYKRVFDMVPLAQELVRRGVPFQLDVVGDGADRRALEAAFTQAGLSSRVRFWGWQSGPELTRRFQELDVLLLLSDSEGMPVAMLEAMGHALVPVVTRLPSGTAEVVRDGENGYLVGVGDFGAFADRLGELARDPTTLARMRHAAWQTSQDYSVTRMVERYVTCFKNLTSPHFPRDHRPAAADYPVMPSCRSRYPFWLRKVKWRLAALGRPSK
jgi:glycosyltransferase involved in cell wall biosynthesis